MSSPQLFGASIVFSRVARGMVMKWYVWPEMRRWPRADALRWLLAPALLLSL